MLTKTNNQLMEGSQVVELLDTPSDNGAGGDAAGGSSILTDDLGNQDGNEANQGGDDTGNEDQGNAGDVTNSWRDALPKEIRDHEAIRDMGKPGELASAYIEMAAGSENSVAIPGEDATDEDRDAFYGKLGRPDSGEDYSIEVGEDLPDATKLYFDDEFMGAFKDGAFAAGLNQDQAQKVFGDFSKAFGAKAEAMKEQLRTATEKQLKGEWKGNFNENLKKSQLALKKLFGEDFAGYLEDTGLGNDARFIKGFLNAYEQIGEDRIVTGQASSSKPMKEGLFYDWNKEKKDK